MANQKNIIELNGKYYDALTGSIIDSAAPPKSPTKTTTHQPASAASVDGFTSPHKLRDKPVAKHPAQIVHQKPQNSKTLMRKSVKRPQPLVKQATKPPVASPVLNSDVRPNHEPLTDSQRLARAEQIHQSKSIKRFSDGDARILGKPHVSPLGIAASPEAPQLGSIARRGSADRLQQALDKATSHEQPAIKKPRLHHRVAKKLRVSPRVLSISASTFAILLIGGFVAYQNVPNLAMRVASARAGVHASLPTYKPAGFGLSGPIAYKTGQITVSFKSNSDASRQFTITQSISSWNSETLLENYVAVNNQPYQTYEDNGKTIYIYNGSNATWVDGGIWYNIQGKASLNSDQLLRIANSI